MSPSDQEERAQVGHDQVLSHVREQELLAEMRDGRDEPGDDQRETHPEAGDAGGRHGPALRGQGSGTDHVGGQRKRGRQQLQRLEDAAPDVSEGRDHRPRGYARGQAVPWPTGSPGGLPGACSSTSVSRRWCSVRCMRETTSRWTWAVPSKIW